jgi:tRNA A37 methylthiotransferase MiaB
VDRFASRVQSLEKWYAADFERRINTLAALMENQIRQELRALFMAELNTRMQQVRKQYEESIYAQFGQWNSQRQSLLQEIEELRRKVPGDELAAEIASTEKVLNESKDKISLELQQLIPDSSSIGSLLQSRVQEMSLKAYLRGLKFCLGEK